MKEFRVRPNNEFLHTASWQEIYALTDHWRSDLKFYSDELTFLDHLIGKYFIWLIKKESVSEVQTLVQHLSDMNKHQKVLNEKIKKHLSDLQLLMENAFNQEEDWFRKEHVQLENELAEHLKQFRDLKKRIFTITEHVLESDKLLHLLHD